MQKIIPIYYSEYGRYINRFRAIPSHIDALKPVERRILLTLHEIARKDLVKSAKIVGACLGTYHPHGDASIYGTLINLVDQGYVKGQGNWGSPGLHDDGAASYRYTECMLEKWVEDLAFEYINYVPYEEFELEPEPRYLPCPLPLGLIGHGIIIGISFYKTVIPKFKIQDLAKRLVYLLEKKGPEVEVSPNFKNCDIQELEANQINKLLTKGISTLNIIPHGSLESKQIKIQGKVPNTSFTSLQSNAEKLDINILDESGSELNIIIESKRKGTNLQELGKKIWNTHLIKNVNFNCIFCNQEGNVDTFGIDDILINNYNLWQYSAKLKKIDEYNKLSSKKFELMIVQIIRYIFEIYKSNTIGEIITKYHELKNTNDLSVEIDMFDINQNKWSKEIKQISDKNIIDICNKRTIKHLVETVIDINKVENDLIVAKSLINNIEKNCFDFLTQLK